jgi:hypothetical protein
MRKLHSPDIGTFLEDSGKNILIGQVLTRFQKRSQYINQFIKVWEECSDNIRSSFVITITCLGRSNSKKAEMLYQEIKQI